MARYIDADALKQEMEKLYEHHLEMCNYSADGAVADCIEFLDNAPTIDAAPQWISVKERLPEKSGYVLVCVHYPEFEQFEQHGGDADGIDVAFFATWNNIFLTDNNNAYNADLNKVDMTNGHEYVTHWMPLPNPPKEESK